MHTYDGYALQIKEKVRICVCSIHVYTCKCTRSRTRPSDLGTKFHSAKAETSFMMKRCEETEKRAEDQFIYTFQTAFSILMLFAKRFFFTFILIYILFICKIESHTIMMIDYPKKFRLVFLLLNSVFAILCIGLNCVTVSFGGVFAISFVFVRCLTARISSVSLSQVAWCQREFQKMWLYSNYFCIYSTQQTPFRMRTIEVYSNMGIIESL